MAFRQFRTLVAFAAMIALVMAALSGPLAGQRGRAAGDTIYGVTSGNLLRFDSATPGTIDSTTPLTGLQASEAIFAIDFRPATGQLYGIGTTGRLYTIDTTTAVATQVGAPFTLSDASTTSMDFNPTVDRIRVVSAADDNFRLNPDTGAVAGTDTNLAYDAADPNTGVNPNELAIGYTNNFAGATVTTLFGIDDNLDILVRQGGVDGVPSPNTGTLFTIGPLGVNPTFGRVGLDINAGNTAFALLEPAGFPELYTINLATGAATLVGVIGSIEVIIDIAVQPAQATPTPSPLPTASPTATPAAGATPTPTQGPAALPPTGGEEGGSPSAVLPIAAALGLASVGLAVAYSFKRRPR